MSKIKKDPRGRKPGQINRTPGIISPTINRVRDAKKGLDRSKIEFVVEYNDNEGNRFKQVHVINVNKQGTNTYARSQKPELITPA